MPFEHARVEIRLAATGTGIKAALTRYRGAGVAKLALTVTGAALRQLGWKDGDAIEVLIGTGGDHGMLRLRKSDAGQATVAQKVSPLGKQPYQTIKLGHQPGFVNRAEKALWCQWEELDDGWIEVVLPRWADETNPARPKPAAPVTASGVALPRPTPPSGGASGRPPKNVTANLMGDPPTGRREMLAKMGEMKG